MKDLQQKTQEIEKSYNNFSINKPKLFNKNFLYVNSIFHYVILTYVVITSLTFLMIVFTNSNGYTKNTYFEYYSFFSHNFLINNTFYVVGLTLNYISLKRKSGYLLTFTCFILGANLITLQKYDIKDFLLSQVFLLNKVLSTVSFFILFAYITLFFIVNLVKVRNYLSENYSFDEIVHEFMLKTDMLKFSYNSFIIGTRFHKLFPQLLYSRDSFYYVTVTKKQSIKDEEYIEKCNGNDEKVNFINKTSKFSSKETNLNSFE